MGLGDRTTTTLSVTLGVSELHLAVRALQGQEERAVKAEVCPEELVVLLLFKGRGDFVFSPGLLKRGELRFLKHVSVTVDGWTHFKGLFNLSDSMIL